MLFYPYRTLSVDWRFNCVDSLLKVNTMAYQVFNSTHAHKTELGLTHAQKTEPHVTQNHANAIDTTDSADDSEDYIMEVLRHCAENPLLPSPSTLLHPNDKAAEALYCIQTAMTEMDPHKKGLSGKDIIHHASDASGGKLLDASMKRQIRAELIRGVRSGDLGFVEDEYTRRKYYIL